MEASVKYVKRQDETVLALEAEVKLIHQWKDEQLKKFRQRMLSLSPVGTRTPQKNDV